jgi:prolyl-tRNA editing enzyme YbaK/EbsC (Cys-tRNA(Pro) deacylase)
VIGGVAPVGHPAPIRTLVDAWLGKYDVVWAAAGHPHAVFPTSFDELLRITGGMPAEVGDLGRGLGRGFGRGFART